VSVATPTFAAIPVKTIIFDVRTFLFYCIAQFSVYVKTFSESIAYSKANL